MNNSEAPGPFVDLLAEARRDNDFKKELEAIINRFSKENGSNTPDFLLAGFIAACLAAYDATVQKRDQWFKESPTEAAASMAWSDIAASAYRAYAASTGDKNFRGEPMPAFGDLPPAIRIAWEAAVRQAAECAESGESATEREQRWAGWVSPSVRNEAALNDAPDIHRMVCDQATYNHDTVNRLIAESKGASVGRGLRQVFCSLCGRLAWATPEQVGSICGAERAPEHPVAMNCRGIMFPRTTGMETEHGIAAASPDKVDGAALASSVTADPTADGLLHGKTPL